MNRADTKARDRTAGGGSVFGWNRAPWIAAALVLAMVQLAFGHRAGMEGNAVEQYARIAVTTNAISLLFDQHMGPLVTAAMALPIDRNADGRMTTDEIEHYQSYIKDACMAKLALQVTPPDGRSVDLPIARGNVVSNAGYRIAGPDGNETLRMRWWVEVPMPTLVREAGGTFQVALAIDSAEYASIVSQIAYGRCPPGMRVLRASVPSEDELPLPDDEPVALVGALPRVTNALLAVRFDPAYPGDAPGSLRGSASAHVVPPGRSGPVPQRHDVWRSRGAGVLVFVLVAGGIWLVARFARGWSC